jgi:Family of unknown function (DUF6335)
MPAKKKTKKAASKKSTESKKMVSKKTTKSKKIVSKKKVSKKKPATRTRKAAANKPAKDATGLSDTSFVDAGRMETEIYEPDPEVKEEFAEAAVLGDPTRRAFLDELRENAPAETPAISGGDLDAAWDQSDVSGEETVGGSNPTPDQDIVEDLGKAVGLVYQDNEPLGTEEKVSERDRHRWELEPESSEDFDERNKGN